MELIKDKCKLNGQVAHFCAHFNLFTLAVITRLASKSFDDRGNLNG